MDKLMLNDEKTEFIVIGTRQQLVKVVIDSLCVCHTAILPSSEVRNLAGWFANHLKIVTQINQTCKAAFFHIFNIRRIRKFRSFSTVQTLVNAFVISRLDYCNSIFFGLPNTELQNLQRIQNTAARPICNMNKYDHITPILVKLHWLPVRYRINLKILLITFKVIHGLAPKYLSELLTCKTKFNYNLRSTSKILLQQPRMKTLPKLGDQSFTVAAPALWNNLPNVIRSGTSINSLKKTSEDSCFKDCVQPIII